MKAFKAYKQKAEIKTIGFLTFDAAFNYGREQGWRAALKCILKKKISSAPCKTEMDVLKDWINKELEE